MKKLAEAEKPCVAVPLVARVVAVEVPIRVVAVKVRHAGLAVNTDLHIGYPPRHHPCEYSQG